jgi:hypothetical protein
MSSATQPAYLTPINRQERRSAPQIAFVPPPRKWKLSASGRRFLKLLDEQSVLVVEGAHLLHSGSKDVWHDCVRQIESLYARASAGERHIAKRLGQSLITPLDSEDIRKIATEIRKLLARQAAMARELMAVPEVMRNAQLLEIADASVRAAVSLASAVAALPRDPGMFSHTRAAAKHSRQATKIVRDWNAEFLSGKPVSVLLAMDRFLSTPRALFESYRSMALTLERAYLKIS